MSPADGFRKVLVVHCDEPDAVGLWEAALEEAVDGFDWSRDRCDAAAVVDAFLKYRAVIVTGTEWEKDWSDIRKTLQELRRLRKPSGTRIVGVGVGHQILASAFGARVKPNKNNLFRFCLEKIGADWFEFECHKDQVEIFESSPDFEILKSSENCIVEVLTIGTNFALGMQCHPEFNLKTMCEDRLGVLDDSGMIDSAQAQFAIDSFTSHERSTTKSIGLIKRFISSGSAAAAAARDDVADDAGMAAAYIEELTKQLEVLVRQLVARDAEIARLKAQLARRTERPVAAARPLSVVAAPTIPRTPRTPRTVFTHEKNLLCLTSLDRVLVVGAADSTAVFFDVDTSETTVVTLPGVPVCVDSRNETIAFGCLDGHVAVLRNKHLAQTYHPSDTHVLSVAISSDEQTIAFTSRNNTYGVCFDELVKLVDSSNCPEACVFSTNDTLIVSVRNDETLWYYRDYANLSDPVRKSYAHPAVVLHLVKKSCSNDDDDKCDEILAATDSSRLLIISAETGATTRALDGHYSDPLGRPRAAWGPTIVTSSDDDFSLVEYYFDGENRNARRSVGGHNACVRGLAFVDETVFTCSFDKSVVAWE